MDGLDEVVPIGGLDIFFFKESALAKEEDLGEMGLDMGWILEELYEILLMVMGDMGVFRQSLEEFLVICKE